jgi:hypothetical protein
MPVFTDQLLPFEAPHHLRRRLKINRTVGAAATAAAAHTIDIVCQVITNQLLPSESTPQPQAAPRASHRGGSCSNSNTLASASQPSTMLPCLLVYEVGICLV